MTNVKAPFAVNTAVCSRGYRGTEQNNDVVLLQRSIGGTTSYVLPASIPMTCRNGNLSNSSMTPVT